MSRFYYPLEIMRLRTAQLASSHSATFGHVRNNNTRAHQGWDLEAPVGTRCYAIAGGAIVNILNAGAYGVQLHLEFNRDGSTGMSRDPLIALYAHLQPNSARFRVGEIVKAGEWIANTGTSGNASANAPHLHFEIRTVLGPAGRGLGNRLDPGDVLGYRLYNCSNPALSGVDAQRNVSVVRNAPTPVIR